MFRYCARGTANFHECPDLPELGSRQGLETAIGQVKSWRPVPEIVWAYGCAPRA